MTETIPLQLKDTSKTAELFEPSHQWIKDNSVQEETMASPEDIKELNIFEPAAMSDYSENIIQWWKGRVEEVKQDYFVATLRDLQGIESIVEISLSSGQREDVFAGAEFAYYVSRRCYKWGQIETVSNIEFSTPYLWTENAKDKAQRLLKELFPEE